MGGILRRLRIYPPQSSYRIVCRPCSMVEYNISTAFAVSLQY